MKATQWFIVTVIAFVLIRLVVYAFVGILTGEVIVGNAIDCITILLAGAISYGAGRLLKWW